MAFVQPEETSLHVHADPLLSNGRIIGDRIMVFPDHAAPNVFYYVPTGMDLTQAYGKPQFFFYKYVYISPQVTKKCTIPPLISPPVFVYLMKVNSGVPSLLVANLGSSGT